MNNLINKYLLFNYLKIFIVTFLIFFALGILINLFEEIEFFKNLNKSIMLPVLLSASLVPSLLFELLPFIVFLSAVFYFIKLRSNKDLISLKIFGYSNLKIIFILSFFSFLLGLLFLIIFNPITSSLSKHYEITKAKYAEDVDHLIAINKNGLWIKEQLAEKFIIINGVQLQNKVLFGVSIYEFNENNRMLKRIDADQADLSSNPWKMKNVIVNDFQSGTNEKYDNFIFNTDRTYEKISSLFKNLNTLSFIDLISNYNLLKNKGYSILILNEKINKFIAFPINLFLMVVLASLFTIGSVNVKPNFYYIIISIIISVIIFYFNDLSAALGQTGKINLTLSIWMPLILVSLFCSIGIIQINEK